MQTALATYQSWIPIPPGPAWQHVETPGPSKLIDPENKHQETDDVSAPHDEGKPYNYEDEILPGQGDACNCVKEGCVWLVIF